MTRVLAESIAHLLPGVRMRESRAAGLRKRVYQRTGNDGVTRYAFPRGYLPHTAQRDKLHPNAKTRFVALCCGRRGGKTEGGAAQFWWNIERDATDKLLGRGRWLGDPHPPWSSDGGKNPEPFLLYFVIAPTRALLAEPKKRLQRMLGLTKSKRAPGLIATQKRDEEGIDYWFLPSMGVRINWLTGDRPDLNVGSGYAGGWCEEAARLKATVWEDNLRASLSDLLGWCLFTTTPRKLNWFWRQIWAKGNRENAELVSRLEAVPVEKILDPQFTCVEWTTAENDAIPGLAEEMEVARTQMDEASFEENYLAKFTTVKGRCFRITQSVLKPYTAKLPARCYAGFDKGNVGETSHKSAIAILTQPEPKGVWHEAFTDSNSQLDPYGDDSWRARDEGDRSTWATRLYHALRAVVGDQWSRVPVFIPPDAPDVFRQWKAYGFAVDTAYTKGAAAVAVTWFGTLLRSDRLRISSESQFMCMMGLHYPEPGKTSKKPWVDERDDEFDALRYAASAVLQDGTSPARAPLSAMGWNRV